MAIALTIAYTATPLAAGVKLAIFTTGQLSAGITRPARGAYRLLTVTAAAAASPANILAAYNAKYGVLVSGKKIFVRMVPISSTGIAGSPFEQTVTIT